MTCEIFEPKPRWPGAPPICIEENMMAFDSEKAIDAFINSNCPGTQIKAKWECFFCDKWHYKGEQPPPSGSTSGKKRSK